MYLSSGWAVTGLCAAYITSRTRYCQMHHPWNMVKSCHLCLYRCCFPLFWSGSGEWGEEFESYGVGGPTWLGSSEENAGMVGIVWSPLCVFLALSKVLGLVSIWVRSNFGSLQHVAKWKVHNTKRLSDYPKDFLLVFNGLALCSQDSFFCYCYFPFISDV